jgi:hypothetical protein
MGTFYPQARAILQVIPESFGDGDADPIVIPLIPKEVRIQRNSYRQADSYEVTFDLLDLPIDPATVRAGAIEIFLFQVQSAVDGGFDNRQSLPNLDAAAQRSPAEARKEELGLASAVQAFTLGNEPQIAGLFDDHAIVMDDSGKWVTITGQDYTDFLIKKQWPPTPEGRARRIPTGKRIDLLLADLLAEADQEGRLQLVVEGERVERLPTVGASEVRSNTRGIPVQQETSYWDVMYKLATRHGFILFVRGLDVVLALPKNLDEQAGGRIRRMAWGRNLTNLELSRRLSKEAVPTIVVKSYDPVRRETIEVDWPEGSFTKIKQRRAQASKSSIGKTEEYQIHTVYGITDRDALRNAARSLHTLLGRSERMVRMTTRDLRDMRDVDLLSIAAGDAFVVDIEEFNGESLAKLSESERYAYLVRRGFNEAIARAIARGQAILSVLSRPLRVREATIEYSADQGVSIEMELVDFVIVDGVRAPDERETRAEKRERGMLRSDGSRIGYPVRIERAVVKEKGG